MRLITNEPTEEQNIAADIKTRWLKNIAIAIAFAVTFFFFIKILFF